MEEKNQVISAFLNQIQSGKVDLYDVRKSLEKENIPEEEIREIIKELDHELLKNAFAKAERNNSSTLIAIGAVLTILGSVITMGTFTGFIPSGNSFLLVYGPILGGISLIISGFLAKNKSGRAEGYFNKKRSKV